MDTQNQFINGLGELKQSLDANTLQLKMIQRQIDQLTKFTEEENHEYLQNLMYPECRPGCKIPSRIPVPSTTFQLKSVATFSTNNKGNFLLRINPWVLASEEAIGKAYPVVSVQGTNIWEYVCPPISSVAYDDYNTLTGDNENPLSETIYKTVDMGQVVPKGLYASYRVVSASARVKYIGPVEQASGMIGGGIVNKSILGLTCRQYSVNRSSDVPPSYNPSADTYNAFMYGNEFTYFNNIDHLVYSKTNSCLEGIRLLYFPIDNKYEEFTKIITDMKTCPLPANYPFNGNTCFEPVDSRNSFWWFIYGRGLPTSSSCIRLELTINYELMPSEKYLNYMPININPVYVDSKVRKKILHQVAVNAITKNKDDDELNK